MDIRDFRASINNKGVLKNNKYIASFDFAAGNYLSLSGEDQRLLSLRCDSVSLPGVSFASADGPPRLGYGPAEKHPYSAMFDDLTLTFMVDADSTVHKALYNWVNTIVNYNGAGASTLNRTNTRTRAVAYEVGYRDKYAATMTIKVYKDTGAEGISDNDLSMTFTAYNTFPMGFPSSNLSWNEGDILRLSIPFAYTDYKVDYPEPQ